MRGIGWLTVRWLFALPVAIAIGIGFQYLSFGINWLIDHSIALLPLGGFQYVLAIPFRLGLAGGAGASGAWWGILAAAIVTPRFKQGMGTITGLFLGWWYYGQIATLFDGSRQYVDIFSILSSYIFPLLGTLGSLFLLLGPAYRTFIEPMTRTLDSN